MTARARVARSGPWRRALHWSGRAIGRLSRAIPSAVWVRMGETAGRTGRLDYAGGDIRLCVDSWIEHEVRLRSCAKEPETVAWIEQAFRPGDVFYDVGANVGAYSLVAWAHLSGRVRVYAFEPGFATFPQLCRNVALNRAQQAIVPLQVALSDVSGIVEFHYQNVLPGGALHSLGEAVDQGGRQFAPSVSLPTPAFRLDDFVRQFGLPWPTHLKIDVDGTERRVLAGAGAALSSPSFRSLLIEASDLPGEESAVAGLLAAHGLQGVRRGANVLYSRAARAGPASGPV
jgi:FkbM family methyltransferase